MRNMIVVIGCALGAATLLACGDDDRGAGGGAANAGQGASGGIGGIGGGAASGGSGGVGAIGGNAGYGGFDEMDGSFTCAAAEVRPTRIVPRVVFLIDGSRSMEMPYSDDLSRWHALRDAMLDDSDGVISRLDGSVDFGMRIYNDLYDAPTCPTLIDVSTASGNRDAIAAAFPDAPPGHNTPTGAALDQLVRELPTATEAAAAGEGPSIVILATDGVPYECVDSVTLDPPAIDMPAVVAAATLGQSRGIKTYVISLAEATGEYATHLGDVAQAGGTVEAFTPANRADLVARVQSIVSNAISCEVALRGAIDQDMECMGTVTLGATELDCNSDNGWRLIDQSHIELTGSACTQLQTTVDAELIARFPCGVWAPE